VAIKRLALDGVLSHDGRHLGTIRTPEAFHNLTRGDDGRTLYMALASIYRIRLMTKETDR
jgi:hypothetical protein